MPIKAKKTVVREVKKTRTKTATDVSKTSTNYVARLLPLVLAGGFGFFAVTTATYELLVGTVVCLVIAFLMHRTTPLTETKSWKEDYIEKVPEEITDWSETTTNVASLALLWISVVGLVVAGVYFQNWYVAGAGLIVGICKILMDYFPRAWKVLQIVFIVVGLVAGLIFYSMNQ